MYYLQPSLQQRMPSPPPFLRQFDSRAFTQGDPRRQQWHANSPSRRIQYRDFPSPEDFKPQPKDLRERVSPATTADNSTDKPLLSHSKPDSLKSKEKKVRELVKTCTEKTKEMIAKYESLEHAYSATFTRIKSDLTIAHKELDLVKKENGELKLTIRKKEEELEEVKGTLKGKEKQLALYKTRMFKLLEINEKLNDCIENTIANLSANK